VADTDPNAFGIQRAELRGTEIAYVHEGVGGYPLLLLHGWPETKRIWLRNIAPLAAAGFEVIVPDLAGFGDSGLDPEGHYDPAAQARRMHALVSEALGHERCSVSAGDFGGVVAQDLSLRFAGLVERMLLFNTIPPLLKDDYEQAGIPSELPRETRQAADYYVRQAREADALAAELDSAEERRRYVAGMYGHRFWATPGAFSPDDVAFMTEPFGDAERFRASIAIYEYGLGPRVPSEPPRFFERNPTPTLILYGPDDHVIPRSFPQRMEVAFPERVGPFVVEGAGHFLQWERAQLHNQALRYFCVDHLGRWQAS